MNEEDIHKIMHQALDHEKTSLTFEEVWKASKSVEHIKKRKYVKQLAFLVAALLTIVGMETIIAEQSFFRFDNINCKFEEDTVIHGNWTLIDCIEKEEDFIPEKTRINEEDIFQSIWFKDKGKVTLFINGRGEKKGTYALSELWRWTKGYLIVSNEHVKESYHIKWIKGKEYLFIENKTYDYITSKAAKPWTYVLRREGLNALQKQAVKDELLRVKTDNVAIEFKDAPEMIGTWKVVDFVEKIEDYGKEETHPRIYQSSALRSLCIRVAGQVESVSMDGNSIMLNWSDHLIIDKLDQTASKCIIKDINGKKYMFYEWKSGDYIYRGEKPFYYVLEKV